MKRLPIRSTTLLLTCAALLAAQDDVPGKLDDYLTRMQGFGFSGVALVARQGKILLSKGYGLADRAKGRPMTADTVISIGSITKQFTAAAILKLEMQGKLHTGDTIDRFFKDVPADKKSITLHQLLTHTAGLRSDFTQSDYDPVERDDYVKRAMVAPLISEPRKEFHYANSGYSLLAAIVEMASGQPYERYLSANLFEPAGMQQTGYKLPRWPAERIARGYQGEREWGTILERPWASDGPYWELRGNGGIHSTAGDMYKWHLALEGDKVLSKEARTKYQTGYIAEGPAGESHYAYGWSVSQSPAGKLIEHNGGNGIFAADFLRYVEAGVVVYVASNSSDNPAIPLSHPLGRIALGLEYVLPPKTVAVASDRLKKYAGTYVLPSGAKIVLKEARGGVEAAATQGEAYALLHSSEDGPSGETAARLDTRTAAIVEAAAKGDYAPLKAAFGPAAPANIEERERQMWKQHHAEFGEWRAVHVLGTAADGPGLGTTAELRFERGSLYLTYIWGPHGLLRGLRINDEAPSGNRYTPESETSFVSFHLPGPSIARLKFELNADRTPTALVFEGAQGKTVAEKQ